VISLTKNSHCWSKLLAVETANAKDAEDVTGTGKKNGGYEVFTKMNVHIGVF
jgi:hypothetical protein